MDNQPAPSRGPRFLSAATDKLDKGTPPREGGGCSPPDLRPQPALRAERRLVVVATSGANHCTYCVVAHGAILRIRAKDPELADRVSSNPWQVELDERGRAIVDLALSLAQDSALFGEGDLEAARNAGLSDDEIWDVGAITALFAMSNRLAHLTALRPNPEFYLLGRVPR